MSQVEETLAWEAEQRPRAALAAALGGFLTVAGNFLFLGALSDYPNEDDGFVSVTESLATRIGGAAPDERSLLAAQLTQRQDNGAALWTSAFLVSIGTLLAMLALLFVYRATRARVPETGRPAYFAAVIGGSLYPIGHIISEGAILLGDKARTAEEARDVFGNTGVLLGEALEFFGTFAVGLAFVLVGLNAMRAGLLPRWLGILSIVVGVLTVVQIDIPQVIRGIFLISLAAMIAGRLGSRPPAWETGRAQPWPTQQQVREARAAAAGGGAGAPAPPVDDAPAPAGSTSAAQQQKRKRKKRR